MESIYGLMEDLIQDNGLMVKCMEKEFIFGRMAENMSVNIVMIKNMDMGNIFGLMAKCFKEDGLMESVKDLVE